MCRQHLSLRVVESVALVQASFRGWRCRCLLRRVFYPLPPDLQRKVLFHMRLPLLVEKHHSAIIRRICMRHISGVPSIVHAREDRERMIYARYLMLKYGEVLDVDRHLRRWIMFVTNELLDT